MFHKCWLWFLAFFHLSDTAVCQMSAGRGLCDFHDYDDDVVGEPAHFITLCCKRCGKSFTI